MRPPASRHPGPLLVSLCLASFACDAPLRPGTSQDSEAPQREAASDAFATALERSRADELASSLAALRVHLSEDPQACQRALLEPEFARSGLRDLPEFKAALEAAAVEHGLSSMCLASPDEPGEWIRVEGRAVDGGGRAVSGAVVRLFATDAAGRYHPKLEDTGEAERIPRLYAAIVTDVAGRFEFQTVRPGPYPGTRNAIHVHVSAQSGELRLAAPNYAVFDDDPLLAEPQNAEQRGEALRIRMRTDGARGDGRYGSPYVGELELPLR